MISIIYLGRTISVGTSIMRAKNRQGLQYYLKSWKSSNNFSFDLWFFYLTLLSDKSKNIKIYHLIQISCILCISSSISSDTISTVRKSSYSSLASSLFTLVSIPDYLRISESIFLSILTPSPIWLYIYWHLF